MQAPFQQKPTAAFVLALIGGILILVAGLVLSVVGVALSFALSGIGALLGIVGVVSGILVIIGAVMIYTRPEQHTTWGVIILVFSIVSWIGAFGGFFIGFILGLIGGILGITFNPRPNMFQAYPQQQRFKVCARCGMQTPWNINFCPSCGNDIRSPQTGSVEPPR